MSELVRQKSEKPELLSSSSINKDLPRAQSDPKIPISMSQCREIVTLDSARRLTAENWTEALRDPINPLKKTISTETKSPGSGKFLVLSDRLLAVCKLLEEKEGQSYKRLGNYILYLEKGRPIWHKIGILIRESKSVGAIETILGYIHSAIKIGNYEFSFAGNTISIIELGEKLLSNAYHKSILLNHTSILNLWLQCLLDCTFSKVKADISKKLQFISTCKADMRTIIAQIKEFQKQKVDEVKKKYKMIGNTLRNLRPTQIFDIMDMLGCRELYDHLKDYEAFVLKLRDILFGCEEIYGFNGFALESFGSFLDTTEQRLILYRDFIDSLYGSTDKYAKVQYFFETMQNQHELQRTSFAKTDFYISEDERKEAHYYWNLQNYLKVIEVLQTRYKRLVMIPLTGFDSMISQLINRARHIKGLPMHHIPPELYHAVIKKLVDK